MSQRTCAGCIAEIVPGPSERNPRKWCSERCRVRSWRAKNPERIARQAEMAARRARRLLDDRGPLHIPRVCPGCGADFDARRKDTIYCSRQCRSRAWAARRIADGRHADQRHRRRAAAGGVEASKVDRDGVYERDRWICQLCHKPVPLVAIYPHPLSPSLDHVTPLALGGGHVAENCQLAHLLCNQRKGARQIA